MKKRPPKKAPIVRVTGVCYLFSTFEMQCPLCGLTIPPKTPHNCERKETDR